MINIVEKKLSVNEYLSLRDSVGWARLTDEQAKKAIDNCLNMVVAYDDDEIIGMGRVVGDGAVICYIQDLIVKPEYHGKGIGSMLIDKLRAYVMSIKPEGGKMMFCLMCAKGREEFYIKNGFTARPTEKLGPGMIQYLE